MTFKEFLKSKGISEEDFAKKSVEEIAGLQNEYNNARTKELKDEISKAASKAEVEAVSTKLDDFMETLENLDPDIKKNTEDAMEKLGERIDKLKEASKKQGTSINKLNEQGIVNPDFSINKNIIRTIVEKHLADANIVGKEEENSHGVKVQPVNLKSNDKIGNSSVSQVMDMRVLSNKHVIDKAGENIFVGGTNTQAVFNQAQARVGIGSISDPLTANDHALDIFNTINISGSLMTLLVYENLEANGELVAEGAAPSADSRVELNSRDYKVFDLSATATISKNLLRDKAEVIDELVTQLVSNLKTVLDAYLFTNGGDNSATPWGVFNTANSCELFNPLLFAGTSPKANIISVIGKAKLQARLNDWRSESVIMNPIQLDQIEDLKDLDENSVKDNRLAVSPIGEIVGVKGMRSAQTTKLPEGSTLVYNSNLQCLGLRQDIETQFGHNNDDLKKRKVSFILDMRFAYGQKAKKSSIYVDSIADAITILKEDAAASLARIKTYATGSDATELTTAMLINAGVVNVIPANLEEYKGTIAGEASIADLAALQVLIDTDNAD